MRAIEEFCLSISLSLSIVQFKLNWTAWKQAWTCTMSIVVAQLLVLNIRNQTLAPLWLHHPISSWALASISSLLELFLRFEHTAGCVSDLLPSCIIELLLMSSCQDLFNKSYFWPGEKRRIWKSMHQPFFKGWSYQHTLFLQLRLHVTPTILN